MGKVHFIVSQNYDNLHIKSGFPKGEAATSTAQCL
jgi:hypothetical protein